jgi:hypothetical protein
MSHTGQTLDVARLCGVHSDNAHKASFLSCYIRGMHWKAPGFRGFVVITPMEHMKVGIPEGTKPGRHVMLHDWPLGSTPPPHDPFVYGGVMGGTVQLPVRSQGTSQHLTFITSGLLNGGRDAPAISFGLRLADPHFHFSMRYVHFVNGSVGRNEFRRPVHFVHKGMKKNCGSTNFKPSKCMPEAWKLHSVPRARQVTNFHQHDVMILTYGGHTRRSGGSSCPARTST